MLVGLYLYTGSEQWVVVGKVKVSSLVGVGASHTHGTLLSHIMTMIVFFDQNGASDFDSLDQIERSRLDE